jgi:hypothetical protein
MKKPAMMRNMKSIALASAAATIIALGAAPARAEMGSTRARVSLFSLASQRNFDGRGNDLFTELVGSLSLEREAGAEGGWEYDLNTRFAGYPTTEARKERLSIYSANIGWRARGGSWGIRAGQIWLHELGGLGALGGATFEIRPVKSLPRGLGELRLGVFGGLEPKIFEPGFASGVKKWGGYAALLGPSARRHVVGYVRVQNHDLTERSVLVASNYIPVGRAFFLYQALEYDLAKPAGRADGGLTYFFANARLSPWRSVEFQGIFHRGRSIDTRTVADHILEGRPISESSLEGFLFESIGGRLTIRPGGGIQAYAGYAQDRTNIGEEKRKRLTFGFYATNLFRSGFDLTVSDARFTEKGSSSYDAWYVSLGRMIGHRLSLEAFYHSSVSRFRFREGEIFIERSPQTDRYGVSANIHILRKASLLLTFERVTDEVEREIRGLAGISYRF